MANLLRTKLQKLREKKQFSLDKLAAEAGISKSYLWELENREKGNPSAEKLSKIAEILGVTLDFLLNEKSEDPDEDVLKEAFFRKYDQLDDDVKKRVKDIIDMWGKKDENS